MAEPARRCNNSGLRCLERLANGRLGGAFDPVAPGDLDEVASDIAALEAEVVGVDAALRVDEAADVACNAAIEADIPAGDMAEVIGERGEAGNELRPDNGLDFDFADLLGDDLLGELLDDRKLLLDDGDVDGLANYFLLLDGLHIRATVEVVGGAVERIEVVEAAESTPSIEGGGTQAGDGSC